MAVRSLLPVLVAVATLGVPASASEAGSSRIPSGWHTYRGPAVSVRYPPSWHATSAPLTPVAYPSQLLAIASYPLPRGSGGADGCRPTEALERLPRDGALVYAWDYGEQPFRRAFRRKDFPPRPDHFRLRAFSHYECAGPSYLIRFRQAGRFVQIHVALGAGATPRTRARVLRVLDSIRLE
jgi:hypothetical protein